MTESRNFQKVHKVNEKIYKQYASRLSEESQDVFWNLSEDQKVFVVEDWIKQGRPAQHLMEDKKSKEDFKPHMMYDPKTGKGIMAKTYERHIELGKKGHTHDKPKEDASNDKSDDGEGLDKVDPKAAKKKFKDRKDKDIDNDGDVDDSDEFLHKKRKAIGKSMKGESTVLKSYVEIMQEDKANASHTASPKADEVASEENPDLPTQKDMAPNTKTALDMHRKGE